MERVWHLLEGKDKGKTMSMAQRILYTRIFN